MGHANELLGELVRERGVGQWWTAGDLSGEVARMFRDWHASSLLLAKGLLIRRALNQDDPRRSLNAQYEYLIP